MSLGWATDFAKDPKEGYTEEHTKEMNEIVNKHVQPKMPESLNFPIRALYAVQNQTVLKNFYNNIKTNYNPKVTYTIWSAEGDDFDGKKVTEFVKLIGLENVYLSLKDDLLKKMNLGNGASSLVQFGLLNLATLVIVTIFRNGLH